MRKIFLPVFLFISFLCYAQKEIPTVQILTSGTKTSLRGLSVVNDNVVWVSGSKGTVGRSSNGGKDWKWYTVKGFDSVDFRDIEAFDAVTAIIMATGDPDKGAPAYILKTNDAGESWKVVYENQSKGIFFDAMEFWNEQAGILIGDPIDGKFFIARTFDGGNTWKEVPIEHRPIADSGEACFAASGTNIRALDNDEAVFVSGGTSSNVFIRDKKIKLPLVQGKSTTGANSIAVWDRYKKNGGNQLVVVGGDFTLRDSSFNSAYSNDKGKHWRESKTPPHGYRSCVEYLNKKTLVSCGLNGVDYTIDNADTWKLVSSEGFHVCRISKLGTTVYLAGSNGKVGKLVYDGKR